MCACTGGSRFSFLVLLTLLLNFLNAARDFPLPHPLLNRARSKDRQRSVCPESVLSFPFSATIHSRYCSCPKRWWQGTDVRFDPIRTSAQLVPRYNVWSDLIRSNPIKSGPIRSSARVALITHTFCIPGLQIFHSDTISPCLPPPIAPLLTLAHRENSGEPRWSFRTLSRSCRQRFLSASRYSVSRISDSSATTLIYACPTLLLMQKSLRESDRRRF